MSREAETDDDDPKPFGELAGIEWSDAFRAMIREGASLSGGVDGAMHFRAPERIKPPAVELGALCDAWVRGQDLNL